MKKNEVAIIIPLSNQTSFSDPEKLSLKHLKHFLSDYDTYFLAPNGFNISYGQIPIVHFDHKYFGSVQAHSRLCLSKTLFNRFSDYKYILMHHLDCLVFKNNLSDWCEKKYDFVGPPWIKGPDIPELSIEGVGNSGLGLKRVEAFQNLLDSKVIWRKFSFEMKHLEFKKSFLRKTLRSLYSSLRKGNSVNNHIEHYIDMKGADDTFLYKYGKIYYPEFNVAPVEEALKFGFETNPRLCFERNNRELPFGTHRWEVYDKNFWNPYLLKES